MRGLGSERGEDDETGVEAEGLKKGIRGEGVE